MRIKQRLVLLLAMVTVALGVVSVTSASANQAPRAKVEVSTKDVPKAMIAQTGCTSHTYLHVACATHTAFDWVEYDCCRVLERNGYKRFNDNRVDIDVRAYRNGTSQCRWVIVRGDDFSKYGYYHPNYSWRNCGL